LLQEERRDLTSEPTTGSPGATGVSSGRIQDRFKDAIVAMSFANLCFVTAWFNTLYDQDSYFNKLPVGLPTLLALLTNILGLGVFVWVMIRIRRRVRNWMVSTALDLSFLFLLIVPANFIRYDILQIWDYQVIHFFTQPVVLLCSVVILAAILWLHEMVGKAARAVAVILSPLAGFTVIKTVLLLLGITHLAQQVTRPTLPSPSPSPAGDHRPRVVWMIFDTSDYRLMFEQRPPNVQLPEFDRLRNESVFASAAVSPGNSTISSLPALISGRHMSAVKAAGVSDLEVTLADSGEKINWRDLPSVFSDARDMGLNTALVGWYHPYDRMLGNGLNYCSWYPFPMFEPDRAATFVDSIRQQIGCLFFTPHARHIFLDICLNIVNDSVSVATNRTYGLVFLHLPPPHTPGVYLPAENRFTYRPMTRVSGYLNNLALADLDLGRLRQAMEMSGVWDNTWVIVSADHSWGQSEIYDGKHDPRIPFIIKPAGSRSGMVYERKINTLLTHDLVLAILQGKVTNEAGVVSWMDANGKPLPTEEGDAASN
jgi:Sulfatase